jgi:hypothetical protein
MRAREYLIEYNRQKTEQNYGDKIIMIARRDPTIPQQVRKEADNLQLVDIVLSQLERADPTKNKEYVQGLAKLYANGGLKMEDASSTLADYLTKFHKLKVKRMIPSPRNDFLRYTSVGDFMSVVDEYPDPDSDKQEANRGSAVEYYNDDEIRVIVPKDETAACYYGQGTRWCTAAKNHNMFDTYNKEGQMYIIIPKHPEYAGEKYQFHFESNQFMDQSDTPVDRMSVLVKRYPSMRKAFAKQGNQYGMISLMSDEDKADMAKQGEAYIQAHGVDQGNGIVTVSLNEPNAEVQDFAVNSRIANIVNAASSHYDFDIPVKNDPGEEGDIVAAYAVIDSSGGYKDTEIVWGSITYYGDVGFSHGRFFNDPHGTIMPRMKKIMNSIGELLETVMDNDNVDFDLDDPWEVNNEALAELRQKYGA